LRYAANLDGLQTARLFIIGKTQEGKLTETVLMKTGMKILIAHCSLLIALCSLLFALCLRQAKQGKTSRA
jgi:hypothetical protein